MNKKSKYKFLIDISVPNTHKLAKTINDKQKKVPRTGEWSMCYVEAKGSTSDLDSNIIYGSNYKALSQSLRKLNLHPNTYTQLQKSVILGKRSIVRNFLNYK